MSPRWLYHMNSLRMLSFYKAESFVVHRSNWHSGTAAQWQSGTVAQWHSSTVSQWLSKTAQELTIDDVQGAGADHQERDVANAPGLGLLPQAELPSPRRQAGEHPRQEGRPRQAL